MPTPIKQRPIQSTNGVVTAQQPSQAVGDLLSQAIPVSEIVSKWIKITIYGQNRTGKTTLACEFGKPALLISCEPNQTGGAISVVNVPGVNHLRLIAHNHPEAKDPPKGTIVGTASFVRLAEQLRTDTFYKTVIIDTATSLQDIILQELMNLPTSPEMLRWGMVPEGVYMERSEKCRECLRPYLNLPKDTVILAQEKDHQPPKGERNKLTRGLQLESLFASDLGGATVKWLHDTCDYVAQLQIVKEVIEEKGAIEMTGTDGKRISIPTKVEKETGKMIRRLRTMYHPNYAAGFRAPNPKVVPEFICDQTSAGMFAKVMKVIRGEAIE